MHITEHSHDGVLVLTISGRLNYYSRKTFQAVMRNAEKSSATHVLLNLEAVDYVDSTALGLLALYQARLSLAGIELSLVGPKEAVKSIFEAANIPKLFPIYPTEEAAIGLAVAV